MNKIFLYLRNIDKKYVLFECLKVINKILIIQIVSIGADWRLTYSTSLHGYSLANVYRNIISSFLT